MNEFVTSVARIARRIGKIFLWLAISAVGFIAVVFLVVYLLCLYKEEYVAGFVAQQLRQATGMPWKVQGPVLPMFSPSPGIVVERVSLTAVHSSQEDSRGGVELLFTLKKMRIHCDFFALLRGILRFTLIVFDSPSATFRHGINESSLWLAPQESSSPSVGGSSLPHEASPGPIDTSVPAPGSTFDALSFLHTLQANSLPPLQITNGTLKRVTHKGELLVGFSRIEAEIDPRIEDAPLSFTGQLSVPGVNLDISLAGAASLGTTEDVGAQAQVQGQIRLAVPGGTRPVEGQFGTSVIWRSKQKKLDLPDFSISAESDSLTAAIEMDLSTLACTGTVSIGKLSLPRWFKFGRNLPPGLQAVLDNVQGNFDLSLTPHGAEALSLRGKAGDLAITGYVGAVDFSKPVVRVDVATEMANIDHMLPFLSAVGTTVIEPATLVFPFPPLAPYPGTEESTDSLPDVGYDVRVRVTAPIAHQIAGGPLEVLVFPAADDAAVTFTAEKFLDGIVSGRLDIGHHRVKMHYDVKRANLTPLPENAGSSVKFDGAVSGVADITIKVLDDGSWDKQWQFTANTTVENLRISNHGEIPWSLLSRDTTATADGIIHAQRKEGIRLEGVWNILARRIAPSWNPKANDSLNLALKGGLAWPPQSSLEVLPTSAKPLLQRRGLNHIYGALTSSGTLIVPLGQNLVPLTGKLQGKLDWVIDKGLIVLGGAGFEGLGSYASGDITIDSSGRGVDIVIPATFKLAPRVLLKTWDLLPGKGVQMPEMLTGKSLVRAEASMVTFGDIAAQADGAPLRGDVVFTGGKGSAGIWKVNLSSQRLDLDNYFPPLTPEEKAAPPSCTPWNLNPFTGINVDAQVHLKQSRLRGLALQNATASVVLQRNKFSVAAASEFYDGTAVSHIQGVLVPEQSQVVVSNAYMEWVGVDLGKLLYDASKDTSYGGLLDIRTEFSGNMRCNADMPAMLSGSWGGTLRNGTYPAFLGSETAGLRNTYSKSSASGTLDKGVLRWNNFLLSGAVVDMWGEGWVDLGQKNMDFTLNVTLAKVPTVPVRFSGPFATPSMTVRGVHMVVYTAQAAGSTVFGLLKGVLDLPGRAVRGVGDLFSSPKNTIPPTGTNSTSRIRSNSTGTNSTSPELIRQLQDAPLGK